MNERYSRQERFQPIGKKGQAGIRDAHILIVGAGALGAANAEMLVRAGVGRLTMIDRDYVEISNLHRQHLYSESDAIAKLPKTIAAEKRLKEINSEVIVESVVMDVNGQNIEEHVSGKTIIIDAVDNLETRLIVNDAATKHNIPFIVGACVSSYGLGFPMIPGNGPCLHCLIDHLPAQSETCDTVGVIGPIVQMVAAHQVTASLKFITGKSLPPILHSMDIWKNERAEIHVGMLKNPSCSSCGTDPVFPYLSLENQTKAEVLCGRNTVQIRAGAQRIFQLEDMGKRLAELSCEEIVQNQYLLSCRYDGYRIVLFKDGRALVHGTNDLYKARAVFQRITG
ncbi:ThiF family adenylyltransferase [Bacillus massilinigeriensis]|uniref:ThiF family adenylyltransferase n=1 Tax=Bacillus mediterraneensis TaxID=1805474 RepID=UPI0008F7F39D|nr:ThiF family adenylyltransferase [Bacillus mediterraneensis]